MRRALCIVVPLVVALPATPQEETKLTLSGGSYDELFGGALAAQGSTLVVGSSLGELGVTLNLALVYVRGPAGWEEQARLRGGGIPRDDVFGAAVALSGERVIAGATLSDARAFDAGAAFLFERAGTSWTERALLLASDGASFDAFGSAVALSGDTAVVGAYAKSGSRGAAYVFVDTGPTWGEQAKLVGSDSVAGDEFGFAVAISGGIAMVSAPRHDTAGIANAGAAYVFERSGTSWIQAAKLVSTTPAGGRRFGYSVAISGTTIAVGQAHAFETPVHVFTRVAGSWVLEDQLIPHAGHTSDCFACAVSIDGDWIVVGAEGTERGGASTGVAYVFEREGTVWRERAELTASDAAEFDGLGMAVSVGAGTIAVGAPFDDSEQGAVYALRGAEQRPRRDAGGGTGPGGGARHPIRRDVALPGLVPRSGRSLRLRPQHVERAAGPLRSVIAPNGPAPRSAGA